MQSGQKLWEETVALYERATTLFLKNNLLLHFAYADFEEASILLNKFHEINYSITLFLKFQQPFFFFV